MFTGVQTLTRSQRRIDLEGLYSVILLKDDKVFVERNTDWCFGQALILLLLFETTQLVQKEDLFCAYKNHKNTNRLQTVDLNQVLRDIREQSGN